MTGSLYETMAAHWPDPSRLALEAPGIGQWNYGELQDEVARYAGVLVALGIAKGDRVVACVEKSPQALFLYLACLKAGFVFVPLNTAYRAAELEYLIGNAGPALIVGDPAREAELAALSATGATPVRTLDAAGQGSLAKAAETAAPMRKADPCATADLAAILYTSGTTGQPKGAMLSHGNLASNGLTLRDAWAFTVRDRLLHALPIFHAHGLFVACHCALLAGAAMIWLPKFDGGEVCRHMPRATVFMGVPTFYTRLLAHEAFGAAQATHMRLFTSGSAPLLAETFEAFKARTGQAILERYGMTETGMITSNPYEGERRAGTVGFPLPGVDIRIVGDGEDKGGVPRPAGEIGGLQVKGPNVLSGYWRMPEKSAEEFTADGWFKTGDIARLDDQGYVHLVGRAKDLIISGGYNVYPKEIETLIDAQPEIEESAVIGVPHADFGEAAIAVVTVRPGAELDEVQMIGRLKERLANYKVPKRIFPVENLPRNAMGKVRKNLLRERYRDAL